MRSYEFRLANSKEEVAAALTLRRQVFVEEQRMFALSDADEYDPESIYINAWKNDSLLMGTVRCYPDQQDRSVWWGGRLAVHENYRLRGIGVYLIEAAVSEMQRRSVRRFLAQVQQQNVKLFEKLGWSKVGEQFISYGQPHQLMEANLHVFDASNRKQRQFIGR
ncbi:MSMEG_0567/Sll0786 family nitrogen starvation N-acetyltransferase [Paenibacillus abyssi]|nr:MSMEG_0567/Sll0786 family nitrogen starvation N-acetyltransferase [Paenibacillus abyssi]